MLQWPFCTSPGFVTLLFHGISQNSCFQTKMLIHVGACVGEAVWDGLRPSSPSWSARRVQLCQRQCHTNSNGHLLGDSPRDLGCTNCSDPKLCKNTSVWCWLLFWGFIVQQVSPQSRAQMRQDWRRRQPGWGWISTFRCFRWLSVVRIYQSKLPSILHICYLPCTSYKKW